MVLDGIPSQTKNIHQRMMEIRNIFSIIILLMENLMESLTPDGKLDGIFTLWWKIGWHFYPWWKIWWHLFHLMVNRMEMKEFWWKLDLNIFFDGKRDGIWTLVIFLDGKKLRKFFHHRCQVPICFPLTFVYRMWHHKWTQSLRPNGENTCFYAFFCNISNL